MQTDPKVIQVIKTLNELSQSVEKGSVLGGRFWTAVMSVEVETQLPKHRKQRDQRLREHGLLEASKSLLAQCVYRNIAGAIIDGGDISDQLRAAMQHNISEIIYDYSL